MSRSLIARSFSTVTLCLFATTAVGARPGQEKDPQKMRQAQTLYKEAVKYYNLGEYDQAIDAFKQAYLLSQVPSLLYNIAQSYRQKGPRHCADAARFYRSYLREKPGAPDRRRIETTIAQMDGCVAKEVTASHLADSAESKPITSTQPSTPVPLPQDAPVRPSAPPAVITLERGGLPSWIPPTSCALGAALAGTGALMLRSVSSGLHDCSPSCTSGRISELRNRATFGYVLVGAGAAAATAGLVLWLLPSRSSAKGRTWIAPDSSGIVAGGQF